MEITLVNLIAVLFHFPWFSEKLHYISYEALNGENVQSGRKLVQINNCRRAKSSFLFLRCSQMRLSPVRTQ